MRKEPLHTKLCESLGIEHPIVAFTHCKDFAGSTLQQAPVAPVAPVDRIGGHRACQRYMLRVRKWHCWRTGQLLTGEFA